MIDINNDSKKIMSTLKSMLYYKQEYVCFDLLCNSIPTIEYVDTNSGLNFRTDFFCLHLGMDVSYYSDFSSKYDLDNIKNIILNELSIIFQEENEQIISITIKPFVKYYLNWNLISEYECKEDFINDINCLKEMLIDTATGIKRIENIDDEYKALYEKVQSVLDKVDLENPNPFKSLWESYNYWSSNLDSYAKRRVYYSNIYSDLLKIINTSDDNTLNLNLEFTKWDKINRTIADIKKLYNEATTSAQFNGIGAMCRSVYNNLADTVYKDKYHVDKNSILPNENQYKNKLLEFVLFQLDGKTNEDFRSYCKKTIDIADTLTHKKTATKQQAALTISAVISILNIITILNDGLRNDGLVEDDELVQLPIDDLPF